MQGMQGMQVVFKIILIILAGCEVQLMMAPSQCPEPVLPEFEKTLRGRDNFAEYTTMYGIYPRIVNHEKYERIEYCYNIYGKYYGELNENFLANLTQLIDKLDNKKAVIPLKKLRNSLKNYPAELHSYIKTKKFDEAAVFMCNKMKEVLDLDNKFLQLVIIDVEKNKVNANNRDIAWALRLKKNAMKDYSDIMLKIINCITTLQVFLLPSGETLDESRYKN